MSVDVIPIRREHIESFHIGLDIVARERKYLAMTEAPPLASTRAFVERCIAESVAQFVAVQDGRVIGACDVVPFIRPTERHAGGLGMWLLPAFRGQGYGRPLIEATLCRARDSGLVRAELGVYDENLNAIALYERVGFLREGIKRKATLIDGVYKNLIIMAIADLSSWTAPVDKT